jgi:subtilase family serine protease/Tol biopolymer transport system component
MQCRPRRRAIAPLFVLLTIVGSAAPLGQSVVRTLEDRQHVAVMAFGGVYDRQPEANLAHELAVRQAIAREFFQTHTDDYDFLVVFSQFDYQLGNDPEGLEVGGRYYGVKNDVAGIGVDLFDRSPDFGSNGRLQGYIDMGPLARLETDPTSPAFERTLSTLAHEVAHRWAAHVRFLDASGSPSTALLGRDLAHWSSRLNSHNSVLYGNEWRDNGDGTFTSTGRPRTFYSPLDLYLMGILRPTEVPPMLLVDNPDVDPNRLPERGLTISGVAGTVTIDDIIAVEGERNPPAGEAPRHFKAAFILLVRPGEQADPLAIRDINTIRDAFATRQVVLTGGRAIIEVFPERLVASRPQAPVPPATSGPRSEPVDLAQGVDWLLSRQRPDASWGDSGATQVRDSAAVLDLLREIPSTFLPYQRGVAWLTALAGHLNVDTTSRRLVAVAPQFSPTDTSFLLGARNQDGGWGLRPGDRSDPLDTALALRALSGIDVGAAVSFLVASQNPDGGWAMAPGGPSSVPGTVAVLDAFSRHSRPDADSAVARALAWLQARQNPDGGFGTGTSSVHETAMAALLLSRTDFPSGDLGRALSHLEGAQLADGSWMGRVHETALAIRALRTGQMPNLTVTPGSLALSPSSPIEGDAVTIRATVANDGVQDAAGVVVRFYDGDPAAHGLPIGADVPVGPLPSLAHAPVEMVWDTAGRQGPHDLRVVVDPDHAIDETNETDNWATASVTVRPPPEEADLAVSAADLAFDPPVLRTVPQGEALTARVRNIGRTTATQVAVQVYDGDPSAGSAPIAAADADVPALGETTLRFTFDVERTGERRYFVVVDPQNALAEPDESNNRAWLALPVQGTLDFALESSGVTFSQNPVPLGRDLAISANVRNLGTTDAYAVRVRVFLDEPSQPLDLGEVTTDLRAGEIRTVLVAWRTSRTVDQIPVVIQIDPADVLPEMSETNNRASALLSVPPSTEANLFVTHRELTVTAPVLQGGSTTVSIPVHNTGFAPAADVGVAFFLGAPEAGGVQFGTTQVVPVLAAGERTTVSVAWGPITTPGEQIISVTVDPAAAVVEFDESDNSAFTTVDVLALPDLVLSPGAIAFSPPFPRQGEPVTITAQVTNVGEQAASNVRVRFFNGDPAAGGVQVGADQLLALMPGGGQATAQVALDAMASGTARIHVQVDPDSEVAESDEANNSASRSLGVQDASFFFSNLYFSPNNDTDRDATEFFYRLAASQGARRVRVTDRRAEEVIVVDLGEPAPLAGSVPWDGRDSAGRIVPDGPYVFALLGADGSALGSATVVVDNNSSPVGDAAGTKFLIENNLTCDARGITQGAQYGNPPGDFNSAGWLADDAGLVQWFATQARCPSAFFYYRCAYQFVESPQVGVYVVAPDGRRTRITPDSWTVHPPANNGTQILNVMLSPDGARILIALRRYLLRDPWFGGVYLLDFTGPLELWAVNADGSGLVQVAALQQGVDTSSGQGQRAPAVAWAGDGSTIAVSQHDDIAGRMILYLIPMDGSGPREIDSYPAGYGGFDSTSLSARGTRVIWRSSNYSTGQMTYVVANGDGSGRRVLDQLQGHTLYLSSGYHRWLDEDRIVSLGQDAGGYAPHLYLVSLSGSAPVRLSPGVEYVTELVFPAAGPAAVFTGGVLGDGVQVARQVATGIWQIDLDGNVRLAHAAAAENLGIEQLRVSPDGRRLNFVERVVTDFRTCDGEEGTVQFCGAYVHALATRDLEDDSLRVVRVTGGDQPENWWQPVGFFPDGNSLLVEDPQGVGGKRLLAVSLVDGAETTLIEDPDALFRNDYALRFLGFTPSGKYFIYASPRDSYRYDIPSSQLPSLPCYKGAYSADIFVLSSLLNLTTQLTFAREGSQLVLRGTATDVNFAARELEAAEAGTDQWSSIEPPSETDVINGVLGRWVPWSEGSYDIRLTATDKAGNRSAVRRRVTWGLTPTITNVSIAPRMFSPDGDGSRDSVTADYLVLGAVNLEFAIYDAQNTLVRTIAQSHAVIGPASVAWDGRDATGAFVPDGIYRIRVLGYDFFVTADSTPPLASLSIGSAFRTVPQKVSCGPGGVNCSLRQGPFVDTPAFALTGRALDANFSGWRLEAGVGIAPTEWQFIAEGMVQLAARDARGVPIVPVTDGIVKAFPGAQDVVGRRFRLTVTDQAGNTTVVVSEFAPQEVILHAWDTEPVPTSRSIEQRLGPHLVTLTHTARDPQTLLVLQYRREGTGTWIDGPAIAHAPPEAVIPWDNAQLASGAAYEVRVVARGGSGPEIASNVATIHSNLFELTRVETNASAKLSVVHGIASVREPLADIRLVMAIGGDPDIGMTPAIFSGQVAFSIQAAPDTALDSCAAVNVPARLKGIGESGRVYYSNIQTVTRYGPPGRSCTSSPAGARLELGVDRVAALECGAPNPERIVIRASGSGFVAGSERLFVQGAPNGLFEEVPNVDLPLVLDMNTGGRQEGTYLVRVTATQVSSDAGGGSVSATASFVVDRSAPDAQITYPASAQSLCPVRSGGRLVLAIEGVADDANFDHYRVEYGVGDAPGQWLPIFPGDSAADLAASRMPRRGALATWDVTALTRGTHTVRLTVHDRGGNLRCTSASFTLQGGVQIGALRADTGLFSPNGDGVRDSAAFGYALDQTALVGARIHRVEDGQPAPLPVRTLLSGAQQLAGANTVLWDGATDTGGLAPDGIYELVLTATNACGSGTDARARIEADSTPPDTVITSPSAGSTVGIAVDVRGSVTDANLLEYRVDAGSTGEPVNWITLATGRSPLLNALLARWSPAPTAGTYTLRLTAEDTAGNSRSALVQVEVPDRQALISALAAEPPIFSPNGDGQVDAAIIKYTTTAQASIVLEVVDATGATLATLARADATGAATYDLAWAGLGATGAVLPDGDYQVRLTATAVDDPARVQVETNDITIDRAPPVVDISSPGDLAYLRGDVTVIGTVSDPHLERYALTYGSGDAEPSLPLAEGRQGRIGYAFGALPDLPDGAWSIRAHAVDLAGNVTTITRRVTRDDTPPVAALTSPAPGALIGGTARVVVVQGSVAEANLDEWTLQYGAGTGPTSWTTIATGTTVPTGALGSLDVGTLPDGEFTLSLVAVDRAGATGEARVVFKVDNTPPTAIINAPVDGAAVSGPVEVRGTVGDANLRSAVVELAPGTGASAFAFSPVAAVNGPIDGGLLGTLGALPPDGAYTLRVVAEDGVGLRSEARVDLSVDTEPPAPPSSLTAVVETMDDVRLQWSASAPSGVPGYHVYRNGRRLTVTPVATTTFFDPEVPDGVHRYLVTAVDPGGLESGPSNEAHAQVDLTPPTVRLQAPAPQAAVGGIVDVTGTASSPDDFREYRVLVGEGDAPAAFTLVRRSPAPVTSGVLTQLETGSFAEGGTVTIRLEGEDLRGNVASAVVTVRIDNAPPAAPVLLSAVPAGSDVTVTWQANGESDIAGYLLFNNDLVANLRRFLVGSPMPYLLQGPSFVDRGLVDGDYRYFLFTIDRAGNFSGRSNVVTVTVESRPPRATIVEPIASTATDRPLRVVASSPDADVASVQFQFKAVSASIWSDFGAPAVASPYEATWDPTGLPYGSYHVRGVATDIRGNRDSAPPASAVVHQDLTPPGSPDGLTARVSEGSVALAWNARTEADLAGYTIYRQAGGGSPVPVSGAIVTDASFTDTNVPDGAYVYTVSARDTSGNLSAASSGAAARVYTPVLLVPALCVADMQTPTGGAGVQPADTVTLYIDRGQGFEALAAAQASQDGSFEFGSIALEAGANVFTAQAVDSAGNSSRRAQAATVTSSPIPEVPTGLAASVTGFDVTLSWNAVPGVSGYFVRRNDLLVTPAGGPPVGGWANASSAYFGSYPAFYALDGNPQTFWLPHYTDSAPWWEIDFGEATTIRQVELDWYAGLAARALLVQRWSGDAWIPVLAIQDNSSAQQVIALDSPIVVSRLRISITDAIQGMPWVYLAEARFLRPAPTAATMLTDMGAPNGRYTYSVRGLNACGVEGPLAAIDVHVGDVDPPAAVLDLTASVAGSDVTLNWSASAAADLAGYNVYREAPGTWTRLNAAPFAGTTFVDPLRTNGMYRYRVTALDASGNESAPSNIAVADVAVAVPPAPILLVVSAPSRGGVLDLAWSPGDPTGPAAGYRLLRSRTAGGPYEPLAAVAPTVTSYRDEGLANLTTYFYVVRAVDVVGNESGPSNEARGTPADTSVPQPPVLRYPTDAANPVTLTRVSTPVTGIAEAGATVTLVRDGEPLGAASALTSPEWVDVELPAAPWSAIDVAPARSLLTTFMRSPATSESTLSVTELVTGETVFYDEATQGDWPVLSGDGRRVAYSAYDYVSGGYHLLIFDRQTSSLERSIPLPGYPMGRAITHDGSRLALVIDDPYTVDDHIWTVDVNTGAAVQVTSESGGTSDPVWSPEGQLLAYLTSADGGALRVVSASGTATIDSAAAREISFSPDGAVLVFSSERNATRDIYLHDVGSGVTTAVPADALGPAERWLPALSPDGSSIAYLAEPPGGGASRLTVRDLVVGAQVVVAEGVYPDRILWGGDGSLVVIDGGSVSRVRLPGSFAFDGVRLDPGLNALSALASDASANRSVPADPILITRDTSHLPDLEVRSADVAVLPQFPAPGDRVRVATTVRNTGGADAGPFMIAFLDLDEAGVPAPIGTGQSVPGLAPGAQAVASVEWDTAGLQGRHRLSVLVDAAGAVVEADESNNAAARDAVVGAAGAPAVVVATDRAQYAVSDTVRLSIDAVNPGVSAGFTLTVSVTDEAGNLAASVSNQDLGILSYATRHVEGAWPASGVLAGSYKARAVLRRADGHETEALAPFSILADERAAVGLTTDRSTYAVGEAVALTGAVRNLSANVDLANLTARLIVRDAGAAEVLHVERAIDAVLLGGEARLSESWSAARPGAYSAAFSVRSGSRELGSATRAFSVTGEPRLIGSIGAEPVRVALHEAFTLVARVGNSGTADVSGVTLRVRVVDPDTQAAVRAFERVVDLPAGAQTGWTIASSSDGLRPKPYGIVLEAASPQAHALAATTTLTVADLVAPVVTLLSPPPGAIFSAAVAVEVLATDDASGVARVEVQVDDGPWAQMTPADPVSGRFRHSYPATGTTEGARTLRVRAVDRAGNDDRTSGTDMNPSSVTVVIDVTPPQITISGVDDGVTYQAPVTPVIAVLDASGATSQVTLDAVAFESGTTVGTEGDHVLEVAATDRAGNSTARTIRFSLLYNRAPTADDQTVVTDEDTAVSLTLQASDPDGDQLTFVVTSPTNGALSGIAPALAYTPNTNFHGMDNFTFSVSDGVETSPLRTVTLQVVAVNDAPIARAGADQAADEGRPVILDGSGSSDVEGDALTFGWVQVAGPPVTLDLADPARPAFVAPLVPAPSATLTFELTVGDGQALSAPSAVNVTVRNVNRPPVADAGPDQRVNENATVTLDGTSSFDPDGEPLTYGWTQTAGPIVALANADGAQATFSAPLAGLEDVTLTFRLVVRDGFDESSDSVTVLVERANHPPIANAGADQTRNEGDPVTLDGTESTDADGDSLTYRWVQLDGPPVTLDDPTSATPTFTAPRIGDDELHHWANGGKDGKDDSDHKDDRDDKDGRSRKDNDNTTHEDRASGGANGRFGKGDTDDHDGRADAGQELTLTFELVVNDGQLDSGPDAVTIHVIRAASPPVCSLAKPSSAELWPPNHALIAIRIVGLTGEDGPGKADPRRLSVKVMSVTQDERVAGLGDGDTSPDAVIDDASVLLRAERSGQGNGRVYRVAFKASDAWGRTCDGSVFVSVPHNRKSTAIDDGQRYDSTRK